VKYRYNSWFAFLIVILLLSVSCSTRKNNFATRTYHTVTAKYNVNFNGKEALEKAIADLNKKKQDNYLEVLPIFYYTPKQDLSSVFPSLDKAIEKASKAVYKHSILVRGKEYVKPMNQAYLMMGKAYFYKQDYNQAKRVFNYIITTYNDWGSVEEATIWLARCEMQQDYFVRARAFLEEVNPLMASKNTKIGKRKINNKVRLQYYAAEAEYDLLAPNGEVENAIENIKSALQFKPKKDFKVRLYFILGQLYEELDNRPEAQNWFLKVIKSTPEYEMEFSARMHLAVNYDGTSLSKKTIMKELNKMLKDSKNEDFCDQIYFAISEIARIDEDDADREYYLAKSVAAFTKNDYQRTFSAVTLADIYFAEEEYMSAQAYYDTALMSLPQNYPNRENIIKKASILSDLVENLQIIQLQDSLQRIAKMSESERQRWVNKMIADYTEEERRMAKEEADRMLALQATQNFANVNVNSQGQSNKWYFYNPGLVSQGATEFYRRFGNRKLEDNWRVSNKTVISFEDMADMNSGDIQEEEEFDEDGNPIVKRETDPKKPAYYTQDLPLTPEALEASNVQIMNAMYNAGIIYFDQLNDLKRSNEMLHKMIQRFPKSDLVLPSYFLLWVNDNKLNNKSKADEAKNFILNNYPDSDYAKLILDPDYYKKLAEAAKANDRTYEALYKAYSNRQWVQVVQLADKLITDTEDVSLVARATYLRAVAIGQIEGENALKDQLTQIVTNFPAEQVAELAKIYLSTLSSQNKLSKEEDGSDEMISGQGATTQKSPFNTNLDENHFIIILVNVHKKVVEDIKYDVSNFNSTYFSLDRFNINSFYINQNEQLVSISQFSGKTAAMNYFIAFTNNSIFMPSIEDKSITVFPISASNFSIYYSKVNERNLYKQFFEENYK